MPGKSNIEWTNKTWNPVTGCEKVSKGCDHCYAETFAERFRGVPGHPYEQGFDLKLWPDRLNIPLQWKKPTTIFTNSMSDLFHKDVPDDFIMQVFETMNKASWHTFQVLTKRPSRVALIAHELTWTKNIWLGTSVESQDYTWRIDKLCQVPAKIRFVSAEPLLGPLDLRKWLKWCPECEWPHGEWQDCGHCETYPEVRGLDWIITGAESGHGARPMSEDWVRSLRDQCVNSGRSFFYKQNALNGRKVPTPELDGQRWMQFPVEM
ncbi:MAG TPA: phage Gp37/Gp68 family protein [Ktedonobacteraceae bacterium]|jgi:protein gp37